MKQAFKTALIRIVPRAAGAFFLMRHRRHIERVLRNTGSVRVGGQLIRHFSGVVAHGPFQGMRYSGAPSGSACGPKIVGSYEEEIVPWIEQLCGTEFDRIIDIGCAEGYYAVGMARRCPRSTVYAFDIDGVARARCVRLAELNGVCGNITLAKRCDAGTLESLGGRDTLIICDIEGAEADLLDPSAAPALGNCTILVELHEFERPGVTAILRSRFSMTHRWEETHSKSRNPADYPLIGFLTPSDQAVALEELRNRSQTWVLLSPKN